MKCLFHLFVVLQFHVVDFLFHAYSGHDGIWSRYFDFQVWFDILFICCNFHCGVQMEMKADAGLSHILIAAARVSDQSVFLVTHWGERLSCFGRTSSSAMRCDDAFWLLVSRPTASKCSSSFRFHFGHWSLSLSILSAQVSDVQVVRRTFACFPRRRHRMRRSSLR